MECVWKFWIASGITIELELVNFELEDEIVCTYDFLEIIKQSETGQVETDPIRHCGTMMNTRLNYTDGSVTLRFKTDMDVEAKGFQINYSTYNGIIIIDIIIYCFERHYIIAFLLDKNSQILCSELNGGCSDRCVSDENGVKQECSCNLGYALAADRKTCEGKAIAKIEITKFITDIPTDIDECLINKGGCEQRCRNTIGSYYCYCRAKYSLAKDDNTKCTSKL